MVNTAMLIYWTVAVGLSATYLAFRYTGLKPHPEEAEDDPMFEVIRVIGMIGGAMILLGIFI